MSSCPKCHGTGKYRDFGDCYQCQGTGEGKSSVSAANSMHPASRAERENTYVPANNFDSEVAVEQLLISQLLIKASLPERKKAKERAPQWSCEHEFNPRLAQCDKCGIFEQQWLLSCTQPEIA